MMRLGLLIPPESIDVQTDFVPTTTFGILMAFACAFLALVLPGPIERPTLGGPVQHDE